MIELAFTPGAPCDVQARQIAIQLAEHYSKPLTAHCNTAGKVIGYCPDCLLSDVATILIVGNFMTHSEGVSDDILLADLVSRIRELLATFRETTDQQNADFISTPPGSGTIQ